MSIPGNSPVILYGTETGTARDAAESLMEVLRTSALGDSSFLEYNFAGKKMFRRMTSLGAIPLMNIQLCDDQDEQGFDSGFEEFKKSLVEKLLTIFEKMIPFDDSILLPEKFRISYVDELDDQRISKFKSEFSEEGEKSSEVRGYTKLEVVGNEKVTADGHFQDTFLISLHNSCFSYKPGDVAQIQPENLDEVIQVAVEALGLSKAQLEKEFFLEKTNDFSSMPPSNMISYPTTLSKCFKHLFDINSLPTRRFFKSLSKLAVHEMEKERLEELANYNSFDDFLDYVRFPRRSISEVLRDFQHTSKIIPIERYFEVFPFIRPRSFSICSSYLKTPEILQVIVARVELKRKNMKTTRLGLCSNYLSRLKKGDLVTVRIQEGTMDFDFGNFTKVFISTGTGIAPFRNFILESEEKKDPFPMLLFFGCRGKNLDNYFGEEWDDYGNLVVFRAFSRDQEKKIYVQNLMEENSGFLQRLIKSKRVVFYIAGSSGEMPKAIRSTLKSIIQEGNLSPDPDEALSQMEVQRLIQFETWF